MGAIWDLDFLSSASETWAGDPGGSVFSAPLSLLFLLPWLALLLGRSADDQSAFSRQVPQLLPTQQGP